MHFILNRHHDCFIYKCLFLIFINLITLVMYDISARHTCTCGSPKPRFSIKHISITHFLWLGAANAIMLEYLSVRLWGALCTRLYYPHRSTLPHQTHTPHSAIVCGKIAGSVPFLSTNFIQLPLMHPTWFSVTVLSNEDSAKSTAWRRNPSESSVSLHYN